MSTFSEVSRTDIELFILKVCGTPALEWRPWGWNPSQHRSFENNGAVTLVGSNFCKWPLVEPLSSDTTFTHAHNAMAQCACAGFKSRIRSGKSSSTASSLGSTISKSDRIIADPALLSSADISLEISQSRSPPVNGPEVASKSPDMTSLTFLVGNESEFSVSRVFQKRSSSTSLDAASWVLDLELDVEAPSGNLRGSVGKRGWFDFRIKPDRLTNTAIPTRARSNNNNITNDRPDVEVKAVATVVTWFPVRTGYESVVFSVEYPANTKIFRINSNFQLIFDAQFIKEFH